jgi:hypothetical protein
VGTGNQRRKRTRQRCADSPQHASLWGPIRQRNRALHRVYLVDTPPGFFVLEGDVSTMLDLAPATYRARIAKER